MLRQSIFSGFIHDTHTLNERIPVNREGASLFLCNYSGSSRIVYVDESQGGAVWTNLTLVGNPVAAGQTGALIVPYGVGVCLFTPTPDRTHIRLRLDSHAEGDGVFFKLETAAPVADYLNY